MADVNIPVGEVFTSPRLTDTNGTLFVSEVYLNGLRYENLEFVVKEISKTRITKLCLNIIPPAAVEEETQEE